MAGHLALWFVWAEQSAAILLLVYAAAHDIAARTIPDSVPVSLAVLGLAARLAEGTVATALASTACLGVAGMLCWWRGWLGGGDVKLLVALALLLPPHRIVPAIVVIGWSGGALAIPYIALRHRLAPPRSGRPPGFLARLCRAERFRLRRGGPLPYGFAIAVGGILELLRR
jgi:prepilin peptidase CpaA